MAEKAKNEERERRKESRWVSVFAGKLRASGAPGEKAFARMIEETGTTHIVTLLNEAEIQQRRICDWCKQHNVGWTHIPLSGGRLEKEEDADHLKRLVVVRAMLKLGECVLVHCSAGMHRTGVAMYTILRHCGIEPEAAISAVQKSRIATYEEQWRLFDLLIWLRLTLRDSMRTEQVWCVLRTFATTFYGVDACGLDVIHFCSEAENTLP